MRLIASLGVPAVHAHANAWFDRLEPRLLELGYRSERSADPTRRSTVMCVKPPAGLHAGRIAAHLFARGISVATPDARIRFSPSWPNALDEPAVVLDALRQTPNTPSPVR